MNAEEFGEEVRRQGYSDTSNPSMYDLVYDEVSGEFKQVKRGTTSNGSVVTEMTEQGFA